MRVAICDDSLQELEKTHKLVKDYQKSRSIDIEIDIFSNGNKLIESIKETGLYDIYILDIVMPEINGIGVGSEIKKLDDTAKIIFLTTSKDYGVESYDVRAFDYILKPCDYERLCGTLDRITELKIKEKAKSLVLKISDGTYSIPLSDIVCVEYYDHRLIVYTNDDKKFESVSQRLPFSTLAEPLLKEKRFLRISASYIINMRYVVKLTANEFQMRGGKSLPISRNFIDSKGSYMNYILDNGGGMS